MASLAPTPAFCGEKQRLVEEYVRTASNFMRVESAQIAALIDGRSELLSDGQALMFEAEHEEARRIKDAAKQAIFDHQRQHGC